MTDQAWGEGGVAAAAWAMESAVAHPDDGAYIEGPIGCVCISASACLPHLIWRGSSGLDIASSALFTLIVVDLQDVYTSPCWDARVLSYRPINAACADLKRGVGRASPDIQDYAVVWYFYPQRDVGTSLKSKPLGHILEHMAEIELLHSRLGNQRKQSP